MKKAFVFVMCLTLIMVTFLATPGTSFAASRSFDGTFSNTIWVGGGSGVTFTTSSIRVCYTNHTPSQNVHIILWKNGFKWSGAPLSGSGCYSQSGYGNWKVQFQNFSSGTARVSGTVYY